ncbi:MAG TPA: metal-dependent hydrolase [Solirubrobacteraceae bacterium]|nr:metal-dependent hydrolase [Solirubrobacteraceae bacterium]
MLPTGHIASGVLLGLRRERHAAGRSRRLIVAGAVACACLPDADLGLPFLLDRLHVRHRLNSGRHHSWMTHTPLFWGTVAVGARRLRPGPVAGLLATGPALHLLLDATANTVALLWPLRRREYGLGLDRMPGVDDHLAYIRRYPATPAGRLEVVLIALAASGLIRQRRLSRQPRSNGRRQAFGAIS